MGQVTERTRIQNKIIDLVKGVEFYRIKYDPETGHASIDDSQPITAKSLNTNEIRSTWVRDPRAGTVVRNIRTRWDFELLLGFPVEVSLEPFEKIFEESAVLIPSDTDNGFRQAILELSAVNVQHPTEDGKGGTLARISLTATPGRR